MPGGFDQQSAGVAVAGFGDPALHPGPSRGVFGGYQPQVGANGAAAEPPPVADFRGQPEPGQRGHAPQAAQPGDHRGQYRIGGQRLDRAIQPLAAIVSIASKAAS
jgi:hypothetical protein